MEQVGNDRVLDTEMLRTMRLKPVWTFLPFAPLFFCIGCNKAEVTSTDLPLEERITVLAGAKRTVESFDEGSAVTYYMPDKAYTNVADNIQAEWKTLGVQEYERRAGGAGGLKFMPVPSRAAGSPLVVFVMPGETTSPKPGKSPNRETGTTVIFLY
jgi:hypothetical protein